MGLTQRKLMKLEAYEYTKLFKGKLKDGWMASAQVAYEQVRLHVSRDGRPLPDDISEQLILILSTDEVLAKHQINTPRDEQEHLLQYFCEYIVVEYLRGKKEMP